MTIELARTFRALDMWQSPAHIAAHLDRANGNFGLFSLVNVNGSNEMYHPDGVYEVGKLEKHNDGSRYVAEILGDDGRVRKIGFSLTGLSGALVSDDIGRGFKLENHPGRFQKVKLSGQYSYDSRDVLRNQVGNLVLISPLDSHKYHRKYFPAVVEQAADDFYRARMITPDGKEDIGHFHYSNVGGILVLEKTLPPEILKRNVYYY